LGCELVSDQERNTGLEESARLWDDIEDAIPREALPIEHALVEEGVRKHHVDLCLARVRQYGGTVAEVISDFGIASPETVARALARHLGWGYFPPNRIDEIMAHSWPQDVRERADYHMIPIAMKGDRVMVAVSDVQHKNEARNLYYPREVVLVIASSQTIQAAYRKLYANTLAAFEKACNVDSDNPGYIKGILDALIRHACYMGASDIHFTPTGQSGLIRLRQDGSLQSIKAFPIDTYNRIVGVIRNDGSLNDLTTTGEASMYAPGELEDRYHLRVQVSRSVRGDTAVIRILDQQGTLADFDTLGYDPHTAQVMKDLAHTSAGLVLITGPTGSGKTTTLYAMLRMLDPMEISIQSVENPVEYECGVWNQYEIRRGTGEDEGKEWLGWFKGLLRNDLDVALLGEVRDKETAKAAMEMANTGHLVFTTLHTNSASRAITRLSLMGLDMPSLADVLIGVTAQRLVRKLCPVCKVPDDRRETIAEVEQYPEIAEGEVTLYRAGAGCSECNHTGYRGRQMVYELLEIDEQVRHLIATGTSGADLLEKIPPERRMWGVGVRLMSQGVTSLDELKRRIIKE